MYPQKCLNDITFKLPYLNLTTIARDTHLSKGIVLESADVINRTWLLVLSSLRESEFS